MNPSFSTDNLLSYFDTSAMVMYVEKTYNAALNNFIRANYTQIADACSAKRISFCYLPYLLQNESYWKTLSYNRPYLQTPAEQLQVQQIYDKLLQKQKTEVQHSAMLLYTNFGYFDRIKAVPIDDENVTLDNFEKIVARSTDYLHSVENNMVQFSIVQSYQEDDEFYNKSKSQQEKTADNQFQQEAFVLADEIRERIKLLKEYNSLSLIGDVIEEIQHTTRKLSPLFITNDYRIFLKDYGMKEVEMPPLPKSVFILFLHHPEGILFKHLADYHDELLSIYRNITVHENIDRAIESIRAMTDPLNNSINEKCSRIRAAFLEVIADDLAQNYYVTGKRGEPKKIMLDRSLVEFQK